MARVDATTSKFTVNVILRAIIFADPQSFFVQVVKDTLNLPDSVLDNLPKYKPYIVPGSTNHTQTNFTRPF